MDALPKGITITELAECAAKYLHRMEKIKECKKRRRYSEDPAVREAFLEIERARMRRFQERQRQAKKALEAEAAAEAAEEDAAESSEAPQKVPSAPKKSRKKKADPL